MDMRQPTDSKSESLPHVVLTSNIDWDPSILNNEVDMVNDWYNAMQDLPGCQDFIHFESWM
jgi:hypothetical protein